MRTARKHIGWYVRALPEGEAFRARMNLLETCDAQRAAVDAYFAGLGDDRDALRVADIDTAPLLLAA